MSSSGNANDASPSESVATSYEIAASVKLPTRPGPANSKKPPVWSLSGAATATPTSGTLASGLQTPLPSKCDRHQLGRQGVCCKELKGEDERSLIDPDIVRDIVIGLSDGLTVPFALTAGLSSLGDSRVVVLGGIAELIAGAISMGVGGFLASQAERDHYLYLRSQTSSRVLRSCSGEMEREVHAILGPIGVEETLSRKIAQNLREVEMSSRGGEVITGRGGVEESGDELRWSKEVGLTAFLLKFGEGLEEVPTRRLYISAFTIGMGYLLGGLVPLLPYFFISSAAMALFYSSALTGFVLLVFGVVKTHVTGAKGGAGGYIYGAVSMLFVGGAAAACAFAIVKALES